MPDTTRPHQVPRALTVAVVAMGVLLVVGTIALVVAIVLRGHARGPSAGASVQAAPAVPVDDRIDPVRLGEPPGSHVVAITSADGLLAITVSGGAGGGADRVLLVDWRRHRVVARLELD